MVTEMEPRPACPGWSRIAAGDRPAGTPDTCGAHQAVIVARRGTSTTPAWRLRCGACGRYWWTRLPGAAAYPDANVANTLGYERAALAALGGFQGRRPSYGERPSARPYYDPAEPRTEGA